MPNQILTDMTDSGVQKKCFTLNQHGQLLHNVDFLSSGGDKKRQEQILNTLNSCIGDPLCRLKDIFKCQAFLADN